MAETTSKEHEQNPKIKEAREHFHSARKSMRKSIEFMLPEGYIENRREARKEFLLGLRSMLDFAIEKSEKKSRES
jgi:hypothetical protein